MRVIRIETAPYINEEEVFEIYVPKYNPSLVFEYNSSMDEDGDYIPE
ncbi:unnamed protein product, partial [marine sediment metagenome]